MNGFPPGTRPDRQTRPRHNTVRADGSEVERLNPPACHVQAATQWLYAAVGAAVFPTLRLVWRHDPSCVRLYSQYGRCRCRPELWCNGGRVQVPDSVFGSE